VVVVGRRKEEEEGGNGNPAYRVLSITGG